MEVTEGYKRTEVGIIPKNWNVKSVSQVCTLINGRGFKPHEWKQSGLPIIRIQNLNGSQEFNYYAGSYDSKILVRTKQLLFAWSGSRGTSFGPHIWQGGIALLNYHTWKVVVNEFNTTQEFLFHALRHLTGYIEERAHGASALVHTQKWEMEKYPILIPSNLAEQRKIAIALSNMDELIEGLGRLIAKKRDLKHAAMQQLLTGQQRLPGFNEPWEMKRLAEICDIEMGRTPLRVIPAYWGPGYKWLSIADLKSKVVCESKEEITELAASEMKIIPKGTLLMSFKLSIGRLCFAGCDLYTNEAICSFRRLQADAEFLYYILGQTDFSLYGKQAVKGYTLNKESLKQVVVSFPPISEQSAIAEILSDMDEELAALTNRLEKTHSLKQGMMQELLTGRTRLV